MTGPVTIDGSRGEGGGQILRTALFLSVLQQRPIRVDRIRAGRPEPGLKPQHLAVVRALESLCGAQTAGAERGSTRLDFAPGRVRPGEYTFDVGTAGSIPLVLQTLLPVCLLGTARIHLVVRGGTDAAFAPTFDWFRRVYVPLVAPAFRELEVTLDRRGFLPAGGGAVRVRALGAADGPDSAAARVKETLGGPVRAAKPPWTVGYASVAHDLLRNNRVAERQTQEVLRRHPDAVGTSEYVPADSVGSAVCAWAIDAAGNRIGGDAIGERGRTAEAVGAAAVAGMASAMASGATADVHLADHLVPWIALGAAGIRPAAPSDHLLTNIEVARAFLGPHSLSWDGRVLSGPRT